MFLSFFFVGKISSAGYALELVIQFLAKTNDLELQDWVIYDLCIRINNIELDYICITIYNKNKELQGKVNIK